MVTKNLRATVGLAVLLLAACTVEAGGTEVLLVRGDTVECNLETTRQCLIVTHAEHSLYRVLDAPIIGFDHVEGTSYELEVEELDPDDPAAIGPGVTYRLIKIVEENP